MATASDGSLIGAGYGYSGIMRFSEGAGNTVNGRVFGDALAFAATPGTPSGIATVGGNTYFTVVGVGIYQVTNLATLAYSQVIGTGSITPAYGLWAGPGNTLIAGAFEGVFQVNPVTTGITALGLPGFVDGVSVSPDGSTAYAEYGSNIYAYSIASPNPYAALAIYTSASSHSPDGTGVISGGPLNGRIVVSNNDGTIGLIDPSNDSYTEIVTGMGRGDLVGPDTNNGTLLVSDYNQVLRLGLTSGSIGSTETPEPASMALLGAGLVGLGALRRRK